MKKNVSSVSADAMTALMKPPQGRWRSEDQHRDALAKDEAVRHFILKAAVSLRNAACSNRPSLTCKNTAPMGPRAGAPIAWSRHDLIRVICEFEQTEIVGTGSRGAEPSMRIDVVGDGTISQQARTYAEYRVFAALTQFWEADKVQRVRVLLRPVRLGSGCESIACTVTVAPAGSDSFRIRTTGPHAYAAINRAVDRIKTFEWQATERLAMIAALREAAEAAGVRFQVSVQHGDPAGVILRHARTRHPDLIVLGTHQRSGFDRFRLGSIAETVTMRASQPVLIVPAVPGGRTAESVMSFNSLLLAVDFSAASIAAVEKALSLAHANSRVTLVHVVSTIPLASASRYMDH
jgi:nucleotide-binding universal stress UspA family protein